MNAVRAVKVSEQRLMNRIIGEKERGRESERVNVASTIP